jgi:hypothetical protein
MYNEKFFQEQFALSPMQAADYAKAYYRIHLLLTDADPLKRSRRNRYYHYEEEALVLLFELEHVENEAQSFDVLKNTFPKFVSSRKQQVAETARTLLSIRDNYIWPKDVYDDWNQNKVVAVKAPPRFVPPRTGTKRKRTKRQVLSGS